MVICLGQGADLHMVQLMPLPLTVSCFSKIQTGFTFLVPADPGSPGKGAVKWLYVCMYVCINMYVCMYMYVFFPRYTLFHRDVDVGLETFFMVFYSCHVLTVFPKFFLL